MAKQDSEKANTKPVKPPVRLDRRLKAEHIRRLVEHISSQGSKAPS